MVVAFWVVFYAWIGAELWLGYRNRRPAGATDRDSGSKAWLIGSVWTTAAVGIGLAFAFPDAAVRSGRTEVFIAGLVLMLTGMALRWYSNASKNAVVMPPASNPGSAVTCRK